MIVAERDDAGGGAYAFEGAPACTCPERVDAVFLAEGGEGIETGWVEFRVDSVLQG